MPLLDHFHAPGSDEAPWESFHSMWVSSLVAYLNRMLPRDRFRAFAQIHLGRQVEADVSEFEMLTNTEPLNGSGSVALLPIAPAVTVSMPAIFPDDLEIRITEVRNVRRLVAAIELVSPSNKKEPRETTAFAARCCAYLQRGIGLMIVDVVTERRANLHDELVHMMGLAEPYLFPTPSPIYATAYRPVHQDEENRIDIWREILEVGEQLPTLPLALKGAFAIPVELESTYLEALERSGL